MKAAERDALLHKHEQQLARIGKSISAKQAAALIADDFVEFGASGKVWDKRDVVAAMATWEPTERILKDFSVRELNPALCLVTYRVVDPGATSSLRSSLWRYDGESWQMLFHQGTPVK